MIDTTITKVWPALGLVFLRLTPNPSPMGEGGLEPAYILRQTQIIKAEIVPKRSASIFATPSPLGEGRARRIGLALTASVRDEAQNTNVISQNRNAKSLAHLFHPKTATYKTKHIRFTPKPLHLPDGSQVLGKTRMFYHKTGKYSAKHVCYIRKPQHLPDGSQV